MKSFVFFSGVLAGAAGLMAAALYDSKKNPDQYLPSFANPETLNQNEIITQLNNYFFKAQKIYSDCNMKVFESSELVFTPINIPGDSIIQKSGNFIGAGANRLCRKFKSGEMRALAKDARKLYSYYKGIFVRANEMIKNNGGQQVNLESIKFPDACKKIDNSLENENWNFDLDEFADDIRTFVELTCSKAEALIDALESQDSFLELKKNMD